MLLAVFLTVVVSFAVANNILVPEKTCLNGYHLAEDNSTCVDPDPYLIFSPGNAIFRIDADGRNLRRIVANAGKSVFLDYHYIEGRIYWVNSAAGLLERAFINGTKKEKVLSSGKGISGFAVDWQRNRAFWTNHRRRNIETAETSGKNVKVLLQNLSQPRGIIVDPNNSMIFWISDGSMPSIHRANLEGEMTTTVLKTTHRLITISLDIVDKRLFWVQFSSEDGSVVGSCDYNGNFIHILKQTLGSHPLSISLFMDSLYYSDVMNGTIRRVNKYIGEDVVNIGPKYSLHPPVEVKVVHPFKQPMAGEPFFLSLAGGRCDELKENCTRVCSRHTQTGQCKCSEGYVLNKYGNYCEDHRIHPVLPVELLGRPHCAFLTLKTNFSLQIISDVNECAFWNHGCTLGCVNIPGSYFCTCPDNFVLLPDMKTCQEVLPCANNFTECSHGCIQTDKGNICFCPEGSILRPGGKKCTGCSSSDNGGCSQTCVLLSPVTWECECLPGYQLEPDGKHCAALGPMSYLLLANTIGIQRISIDGTSYNSLVEEHMESILALDYDPVEKKVYFTNTALKRIERANLDGREREVLVHKDVDLPEGLAVDWINRKLYWTDRRLSSIERSDLSGLNREMVIREDIHKPRAITLHSVAKKLFWTDVGERPSLESASLEGGDRVIIANTSLVYPSGLTIDYVEDKLYWCDSKRSVIEVADLDGSNRRILTHNEVGHPFDVAVFEDYVWFTDWATSSVVRVDKRSGQNRVRLHGNMERPSAVVIVHPLAKPGANPCLYKNGGCSQLCENKFGVAHCSCDKHFIETASGRACRPVDATMTTPASGDTPSRSLFSLNNKTLRDDSFPLSISSPSSSAGEADVEEEQTEDTLVTEKMVSDQDDCSSLRCDFNARCLPHEGSAACQCVDGFTGDGENCRDIDECTIGIAPCNRQVSDCINTEGSYLCECHAGYIGDGLHCSESITATSLVKTISPHETTTQWPTNNLIESCPSSHETYCLYGGVCFYIPEIGSYACNCVKGYMGERCQFSDLEWWELQQKEEEKRRSLTIAVCMVILISLLSAAACITYCYGAKRHSPKSHDADELSDTCSNVDSVTETMTNSTQQFYVMLEHGSDGEGNIMHVIGGKRTCPSCSSETGESFVSEEPSPKEKKSSGFSPELSNGPHQLGMEANRTGLHLDKRDILSFLEENQLAGIGPSTVVPQPVGD
uniref:Epidermal growth factor n=1 Tax=Lepisosteus oculatus TaxID=7918 RepID=W5N1G8_LEPOC|nr:PREDICTED: pro-epidermal growth factor isoform X1 [Lepisosteus oculatus]